MYKIDKINILIVVIRVYQLYISPFLYSRCKFYPTCSEYIKLSILKYGNVIGLWLGLKRIVRCCPFIEGGYDPVP